MSEINDIFWSPSLQSIEELAHDLYDCMCPHIMQLLGKIGNQHPNCPTNLMDVDVETYSAMLRLADGLLSIHKERRG